MQVRLAAKCTSSTSSCYYSTMQEHRKPSRPSRYRYLLIYCHLITVDLLGHVWPDLIEPLSPLQIEVLEALIEVPILFYFAR